VTTPALAALEFVPPSVPVQGLVETESATALESPVSILPYVSSILTVVENVEAAAVEVGGCVLNTSLVAAAGVLVREKLAADETPGTRAVTV
jgi:hypothetical protein